MWNCRLTSAWVCLVLTSWLWPAPAFSADESDIARHIVGVYANADDDGKTCQTEGSGVVVQVAGNRAWVVTTMGIVSPLVGFALPWWA